MTVRLPFLALACAAAGCTPAMLPASFREGTPLFEPARFFAGETRSSGVREDRGGAPVERLRVTGTGTKLSDGGIRLEQSIVLGTDAPTTRTWDLHPTGAHGWTGTLTDAVGTVQGEAYGDVFHIDYAMASPPGARMEQWLYLQPDGRTVVNEATVTLLGVVVARLSERITHQDP